MAQDPVAPPDELGAIAVVVDVVLVGAAIAIVDAALLELARILALLRDLLAFGGRPLLVARAEAHAVGGARLRTPVQAVRVEANTLAPGHADIAPHGASAPPTGDAVARAAARARDGREKIVDLAVAIVVDAVADFGHRLARARRGVD